MKVELRPLFSADSGTLPLDLTFDLSDVDLGGGYQLRQPVRFIGGVCNRAGVVTLEGRITAVFSAPCDRCGEETDEPVECEVDYVLTESMAGEERDDYWVVPDGVLDLDEVVRTELIPNLPTKHLCSPDCKGLCPTCGANRNKTACGCSDKKDNPFADALANFFD